MKFQLKILGFPHLLALIIILGISSNSFATIVDQNGGYNLVMGIENGETKPANVETYVNNIKAAVSALSIQMWIATRESFFIRNLQIVAPASWEISAVTTTKSFKTADIRISSAVKTPTVKNPNLCGQPGDFIELPKDIFNTAQSGSYGLHWKVLLVQWAKYRWGVHEEHGIPGDKRFPYFIKNLTAMESSEPKWLLNGCTNAENNKLAGIYRRLNGTPCDPTLDSELDLQCRFYPDKSENVAVTSSLMHFHFMESVTQFCDASTHQKNVPTKQNIYCDNKSVMETIESSPDFKAIQEKATSVPSLKTELLTAAAKPVLYVLLDSGIAGSADAVLINKATLELGKFFANIDLTLHKDLMVTLAQFPTKQNEPFVEELAPLDFLSKNKQTVIEAIGNRNIVNISHQDFGLALQQAVASIREKSPSEGGNILFLKTTGATKSVEFTVEKEIELALRAEKIKLFTIEITDFEKHHQNLAQISGATQGNAIAISRADDVSEQIPLVVSTWLNYIVLAEYGDLPDTGKVERIVLAQEVEPGQMYKIPVLANTQTLTFILTTPASIAEANVEAGIITPEVTIRAQFKEGNEYGKNRFVYTGVLDTNLWIVNEVSFKYPGTQNGRLTVLSNGDALPAEITLRIQTSAADNTLDYATIQNSDAPFVVTAEVLQGIHPVIGAKVIATIQYNNKNLQIPLLDGNPGLTSTPGDGTYSAIVLLPENGQYTISVTATKDASVISLTDVKTASFIPPDQNFETTQPVLFPSGVTKIARLASNILVTNADQFVTTVQKIRDLSITVSENQPTDMTFTFSTPRIFNLEDNNNVPTIYTIYSSLDQSLLMHLDVKNIPLGVNVAFTATGGDTPGSIKNITFSAVRDSYTYYVIVGWSSVVYSSFGSNVVGAPEAKAPETSTTTTTASTTAGSTESTGGPSTTNSEVPATSKPTTTESSESTESTVASSSTPIASTQSTPKPEANKPWRKTTAGIIIIVAISIACLTTIGAAYWFIKKRRNGNQPLITSP